MDSALKLEGFYRIIACSADTGEPIDCWIVKNQLMTINQSTREQMLLGTYSLPADALQIKYIALGTDATAASASDTTLGSEQYRRAVTQISRTDTGTVKTVLSIPADEANFTIREIGVYCGPDATAAPNTGTLLSRAVVNIDNNSNITLNIVRYDICTI